MYWQEWLEVLQALYNKRDKKTVSFFSFFLEANVSTRKKVLVSKVEATALTEANLTLSASSIGSCGSWSLSAHTSPPPRHLRTLQTSLTCNFSGFACVSQKTLVMVLLCCRYSKKAYGMKELSIIAKNPNQDPFVWITYLWDGKNFVSQIAFPLLYEEVLSQYYWPLNHCG